MKNPFLVIGVLLIAFMFGVLVADYGETMPGYTVDGAHILFGMFLFVGLFGLGIAAGKELE